jgi:protein dithiol:quinone oxidoreductase
MISLYWFGSQPHRWYGVTALVCLAMLVFGLYLQHGAGLDPCPMCIVQRYALILVLMGCSLASAFKRGAIQSALGVLSLLLSGFGAFVAARQSWLQWFPPETVSCGRDFYGMIETFPLQRVVPMIFKGSGDCTKVDWTFLGLSIANWSLVWFVFIFVVLGLLLASRRLEQTD